jgi:cytochrome P450
MAITDGTDLISPAAYGENGPPHDTWTRLRRESPVHHCAPSGFHPFWAVTRHEDICWISKQPDVFLNAPGIVVTTPEQQAMRESGEGLGQMRTIIEMDPPEHRSFRKVASPYFTPRSLGRLDEEIDRSARETVDRLAGATGEGECDFAVDVAAAHPLRILSSVLGVSRDREPDVLRLTNQLFAADDPELQRQGVDRQQAIMELGTELYALFDEVIQDRRANPKDDLASVIANAKVDGEPMGPMETFGYALIVFTAGHDTTKNSLAGGMHALIENPDELEKLRSDPSLVNSAVEEIVRWTSPVNYMKRTVASDVEVRDQKLKAGEELVLFYASGNRDEDVFEDPFRFEIDREKNPHVGFGIGEHFCLGSHLARRSQRALFRELATRLEHVELAGKPEQIASSFVVGLKHLPIRYRLEKRA